jgi:carbonic anhydrase
MYQQIQQYLDHIRDARVIGKGGTLSSTGALQVARTSSAQAHLRDSAEQRFLARVDILNLLVNNRKYVEKMIKKDQQFFSRLANVQTPEYLYIGCADSRVPANEILGLLPGEVFVHRNIAGLVVQSDFNMLSVLHYAVDYLKVKHIIVCGHYGCGGVRSTMLSEQNLGIFQNWTKHIVDLHDFYKDELDGLPETRLLQKLCELNVMWQVKNLCQTTIVQGAWDRKQTLHVHGLIYDITDGLLMDMGIHIDDSGNSKKFVERVWGKRFFPNCQTFIAQIDEVNQDKLKYLADQLYL